MTILIWSTATATYTFLTRIPPFEFLSIVMLLAFIVGLGIIKYNNKSISRLFNIPIPMILIGVGGIFFTYFFYFSALIHAPAREVNLLNYLWPLFIVLFSALLPKEHLKLNHLLGSLLGLFITFLLISKDGMSFNIIYIKGYSEVLLGALLWSIYSVLSRFFTYTKHYSVTLFCFISSCLALGCHMAFEKTLIPNTLEILLLLFSGTITIGATNYMWSFAMKRGNIGLLGMLSYSIPILSTLLLLILGID